MSRAGSHSGPVRQLSPRLREQLVRSLRAELGCELAFPEDDENPPGAVDYQLSLTVSFDIEDASPGDRLILEPILEGPGRRPDEDSWITVQIGSAQLVVCDVGTPTLWEALDAREADLEFIASVVLDPATGELADDFEDQAGAGGRLIIVNTLDVSPQWRGQRFGLLGTGLALRHLAGPGACAVLYPMKPGLDSPGQRPAAGAGLTGYWARLGFTPFREGIHYLDLTLTTLDIALAALREPPGESAQILNFPQPPSGG